MFRFLGQKPAQTSLEIASRSRSRRSHSSPGFELSGRGLERTRRTRTATGPTDKPQPTHSDSAEWLSRLRHVRWMDGIRRSEGSGPDPTYSRRWLQGFQV